MLSTGLPPGAVPKLNGQVRCATVLTRRCSNSSRPAPSSRASTWSSELAGHLGVSRQPFARRSSG